MLNGFQSEEFAAGVAMIPKPKSEAWLICALTNNTPKAGAKLEDRSGNDDSPKSLKQELQMIFRKRDPKNPTVNRELLNALIEDGTIHHAKICMPSFAAFCDDFANAMGAD